MATRPKSLVPKLRGEIQSLDWLGRGVNNCILAQLDQAKRTTTLVLFGPDRSNIKAGDSPFVQMLLTLRDECEAMAGSQEKGAEKARSVILFKMSEMCSEIEDRRDKVAKTMLDQWNLQIDREQSKVMHSDRMRMISQAKGFGEIGTAELIRIVSGEGEPMPAPTTNVSESPNGSTAEPATEPATEPASPTMAIHPEPAPGADSCPSS